MNTVIHLSKYRKQIASAEAQQGGFRLLTRAVYDRRLSRYDLDILALMLSERHADEPLQAYLRDKDRMRSCAKLVSLGYLDSDGPYQHFSPSGLPMGWFQDFTIASARTPR